MGKVPHRKRLTRRKDRDPRKRKKPPDTDLNEDHQRSADTLFVDDAEQTQMAPSDRMSEPPCSNSKSPCRKVVPVNDPVPLTPLVEKLKQHLRRIRYENSSRRDNNTLLIP